MAAELPHRAPLGGYNHNIRYNTRVFHVQTEDFGLNNPQIVTQLFIAGMIVAVLRSSYAHLMAAADRDQQVRTLMQEQHKNMMKQLRRGDLDAHIEELNGALPSAIEGPPAPMPAEVPAQPAPVPEAASILARMPTPVVQPQWTAMPPVPTPPPAQPASARASGVFAVPLDDPAFGGLPMFEWDSTDTSVLDLDLDGISALDLDAVPQSAPKPAAEPEEFDLDAPDAEQGMVMQGSVLEEPEQLRDISTQVDALAWSPPPSAGVVAEEAGPCALPLPFSEQPTPVPQDPEAPPSRRRKPPSLPMLPVGRPVDRSIFLPPPSAKGAQPLARIIPRQRQATPGSRGQR